MKNIDWRSFLTGVAVGVVGVYALAKLSSSGAKNAVGLGIIDPLFKTNAIIDPLFRGPPQMPQMSQMIIDPLFRGPPMRRR